MMYQHTIEKIARMSSTILTGRVAWTIRLSELGMCCAPPPCGVGSWNVMRWAMITLCMGLQGGTASTVALSIQLSLRATPRHAESRRPRWPWGAR